jgi:hypothetical protein
MQTHLPKKEKAMAIADRIMKERFDLSSEMAKCYIHESPRFDSLLERSKLLSKRWWFVYKNFIAS